MSRNTLVDMLLVKDRILPNDLCVTVPVVIIGNGPSGICLSYLLSGYTPYLAPGATHPNPLLLRKLEERPDVSLLEQDLEYLSEGLEGRSSNPAAVLFDTLLLPDGDFGQDCASALQWRRERERSVPHLVLGKGPPGGAWHAMEGSMRTVSLANWMELPGLKLKDWVRDKRRNLRNDRATPAEIASYYQHFVSETGLQSNFVSHTVVTSVRRALRSEGGRGSVDQEHGERPGTTWEVRGYQKSREGLELPFAVSAENVVLATGTHDKPARLGVEGEDLPFICHSFWEFEAAIARGQVDQHSDPVLIVGAGLTAADGVLTAHHLNTPVCHAFRRAVTDPALIFNQLPKVLYPEYHKVHQMMQQQQQQEVDSGFTGSYPGYVSYPKHRVVAFKPDHKCVLEGAGGRLVLKISMALVLIGAHPNLSFLQDSGRYLGIDPQQPISCRGNPVDVHPFTYESVQEPGLFAMGPLVGDNFVRFLKGGALGIASTLSKRSSKEGGLSEDSSGQAGSCSSLDT
ncbi:oxidative stress-induced growth inhibitor 2-like isoform X1 [Acipenser ruthenus]|uniref:oxidative stress-induced growth inhibitor 2-like isoform X1 n=2 Tax=Acipenser ruthenus TaxID=7906 RepID=UPI002740E682|nr:oxidative stress-induced growth inhibitor 2-like isoform X1 [Acipenser ruthenus]